MAWPFLCLYRKPTDLDAFALLVDVLQGVGASLLHPTYRAAIALDIDGNSVQLSPEEVAQLVTRRVGESVNICWWFTSDINMICQHKFAPGDREVQRYYLDGLYAREADEVVAALEAHAFNIGELLDGLIVDRTGRTEDFDWDRYVWYEVGTPAFLPDRLVLRRQDRQPVAIPPHATAVDIGRGLIEIRPKTGVEGSATG